MNDTVVQIASRLGCNIRINCKHHDGRSGHVEGRENET